jgi:hypothetical protein
MTSSWKDVGERWSDVRCRAKKDRTGPETLAIISEYILICPYCCMHNRGCEEEEDGCECEWEEEGAGGCDVSVSVGVSVSASGCDAEYKSKYGCGCECEWV